MENLPQNENNIQDEEFSTVFSDPSEHKETAKKHKSKRSLKAISLLLVVAILIGGIFAVIKFIPEKVEENTSSSEKLELLDYYDYDIKEITLKNKNGTFNLYSKVVEAMDETTSETVSETFWYLKGYDTDLTESDSIKTVVNNIVSMDAIRKIDSKTKKECGLENPVVTADVTPIEGDKFTVEIGGKSPDNAGVYVKFANEDTIYLLGSMLDEELDVTALDFASLEAQTPITLDEKYSDYVSGDSIISFDSITVSGINIPKDVVLTLNEDEKLKSFVPYYLTSPMKRTAENGDTALAVFSQGFPVSGAYSYDVKKATLEKFGLDKPDFKISAKFDDYVYTYSFKKQKDGDYAYVGNDSKNVKKVTVDECGFLTYTTQDFYSKIVFLTPIDIVSNLKIETAEASHSFNIASATKNEDEKKYTIECDGKILNSTYFQSFYQFLCGLESMDFETESTTQKPVLTMTYTYNDKSLKPTVVEFVKINATKYQYSVDGVAMGRIGSASYNKINKNLERLLAGKQIVVN